MDYELEYINDLERLHRRLTLNNLHPSESELETILTSYEQMQKLVIIINKMTDCENNNFFLDGRLGLDDCALAANEKQNNKQ